jgi:hypothetical protein
MRAARPILVCMLVVLVSAPFAAAEDKWGLEQIAEQLEALRQRVKTLAERAALDPRELQLEKYLKFTADDWENRKREPRAEEMLGWVFDKDCHPDLRQKIADALIKNIWKDPDLSSEAKRGQSSRSKLSEREIVPQLTEKDDPQSRRLADHLLVSFWGEPRDPEARNYDWRKEAKRGAWKDARRAWKKLLDKK